MNGGSRTTVRDGDSEFAKAAAAKAGVRTYVLRSGRLSRGAARTLHTLLPVYGITPGLRPPEWSDIFGADVPLHAEIGSGSGESVLHYARTCPATGQIALELYPSGIASLLRGVRQAGMQNVRAVMADAMGCLETLFAARSLAGLRVFYPDPWPKKRHRKRRMVDAVFLERVHALLAPGGEFAFATDWPDYFEQVCAAAGSGWRVTGAGCAGEHRAGRPVTRFERRAMRQGGSSFDLRLRRV